MEWGNADARLPNGKVRQLPLPRINNGCPSLGADNNPVHPFPNKCQVNPLNWLLRIYQMLFPERLSRQGSIQLTAANI
jgi:hypothetical protein